MASRGRTGRRKIVAKKSGRQSKVARGSTAVGAATDAEEGGRKRSGAKLPGRLTAPVLVLNLNYVPVNVCTVRRAIVLVAKGKAELLEQRADAVRIRTFNAALNAPSIIRLVYLVKRPFAPRRLSKKEVFLRDHYTCQYCGKRSQHLTLDHVVPRRQHGAAYVGQRGGCLRAVQPAEGGPHTGRSEYAAEPPAHRAAAESVPHPGEPHHS